MTDSATFVTIQEVWNAYWSTRSYVPGEPSLTRARTAHTCEICWTPIVPGTLYVRETVWPNSQNDLDVPGRYKAHRECNQAWELYGAEWDWEIPHPDDWAETLAEHHVQNPHPQPFTVEEVPHDRR